MHVTAIGPPCDNARMFDDGTDPALTYLQHVLAKTNWTMNELAERAGVAASTINRPLRGGHKHSLSRKTLVKIARASGIQPPPTLLATPVATDADPPPGFAAPAAAPMLGHNEVRVVISARGAEIHAHVDRAGLAALRAKIDLIEKLLETDG